MVVLLMLVTAGVANAIPRAEPNTNTVLVPVADVYVDKANSGTNFNGYALDIAYSSSAGGNTPSKVVFLKVDLSSVGFPIQSAKLSMYALGGSCGAPAAVNIGIFPVTDNTWTETGLTWPGPTASGGVLTTLTTTTTPGRQETGFDTTLGAWLESQRTGGVATLRLEITTVGNYDFLFDDREQTGKGVGCAVSPLDTTQPQLTVSSTPNAVTLTTFGAADPTVNWPLIVGLGALALFIAAGVVIYRRRAAAHA